MLLATAFSLFARLCQIAIEIVGLHGVGMPAVLNQGNKDLSIGCWFPILDGRIRRYQAKLNHGTEAHHMTSGDKSINDD